MIYKEILVTKNFQVAEFLYKTYGAWVILEEGETKEQCFKQGEKDLTNAFKFNNPHLFTEESSPIVNNKVENVDKELQRLDLLIEDCSTLDELKSYQFVVKGESKKKYDEKFKLLSNGTAK